MAHHHHHSHHSHRDLEVKDAPLDAVNQSLADALRASFGVLKLIMCVLVVLFVLSGIKFIDNSEEAVVVRFGKLLPGVRDAGVLFALPYPVHEALRVSVHEDNVMVIDDHFIALKAEEKDKPLSSVWRSTLDPVKDGALMTSDGGLAHVRWRLVYRIEDLMGFLRNVADSGTKEDGTGSEDTERLIKAVLDNAAVHAASGYTAEEITRYRARELADEVRLAMNQKLEGLGTGIRVVSLEIPTSSVPIPTLKAFQAVSSAESQKQKRIRVAQQTRDNILNATAGAAHPRILEELDAWDAAKLAGDSAAAAAHQAKLHEMIEFQAGGESRALVSAAKAFYTEAVQDIQGDLEEYETVMGEYLHTPELLYMRLWAETKRKVFDYAEVEKILLPEGQKELRVIIGPDPKQRALDEMERISLGQHDGHK